MLLSGHDTTLVHLLKLLISKKAYWKRPSIYKLPYGSEMMINVVKKDKGLKVEVLVNRKRLQVKGCPKSGCSLRRFSQLVDKYTDIDIPHLCDMYAE